MRSGVGCRACDSREDVGDDPIATGSIEPEGVGGGGSGALEQRAARDRLELRGDQIAILSGVKRGEEVVTSGVFKLRNGAAISIDNKVQPSNKRSPQPEDS